MPWCACAAPLSTPRSCRCALGPALPSWAGAAGKGDLIPHQSDRRCLSSMQKKRLWWEGKAGFNCDLKLQHSSLPWSLCCWDLWRCITAPRVSKTEQFQFTLNWEIQGSLDFFLIFVVRGKQILIALFYIYSPLSPPLIFSGSVLIYHPCAPFVKQYHKVRKRTFPKDYSKINYFRHREAA